MAASALAIDEGRIADAFERAPGLVETILRSGPYAGVDPVMRRATAIVETLSDSERVALLDAHPRIGGDRSALSDRSAREQGEPADAGTMRELARLNDEYERRFGFRCVVFVARRPKAALLPILRERVARDRATELRTGIAEFLAIARDRLEH